jgi:hypothetical protein
LKSDVVAQVVAILVCQPQSLEINGGKSVEDRRGTLFNLFEESL